MVGNKIIILMVTVAVSGMAACASNLHIISENWAVMGYSVLTSLISQYVLQSFSNGSDNQSPRSQCRNYDGKRLCVSWAVYSPHGMYLGERSDVSDFAAKCALEGKSAEMRVNLTSGTGEMVCVSQTGCKDVLCHPQVVNLDLKLDE
ncbi:hypothetical protein V1525DRAFT_406869 [Lipomyces kononenkoae]|uniref:Uncharacterized protein n=1 Tax=Lipomyces kononenkoae TaxID=34357 RepID=A0ACC3SXS7_LIPKO